MPRARGPDRCGRARAGRARLALEDLRVPFAGGTLVATPSLPDGDLAGGLLANRGEIAVQRAGISR
ncbi:MAG TPA: hypothetical protein VFG35_04250 [Actinoplanes sp.]|nr:hypothetical protein [Actinoplanes sp.]